MRIMPVDAVCLISTRERIDDTRLEQTYAVVEVFVDNLVRKRSILP